MSSVTSALRHNRQGEGCFPAQPIRISLREHDIGKRDNALKLRGIMMFQAWLELQ
jgi:hypothetical protein